MKKWKTTISLALLFPTLLPLDSASAAFIYNVGPWQPRVSALVLGGDMNQVSGFIDGLLPIWGDPNSIWFLDGAYAAGRNSQYFGSIGSGIRKIKGVLNNDVIVGAFAFADTQQTRNHTQAWLVNPGMEILTNHAEVRLQGYLPVNHQIIPYNYFMASNFSGETISQYGLDINNLYYGAGHEFFDTPVALADEYGPGVELTAGVHIPFYHGGWLRGVFYHYGYQQSHSITGGGVNIEFFANKYISIIVQDNYDNQFKNQISAGIQFTLGGPDQTQVENVSNRMEEIINRHLARRAYGQAVPTRTVLEATGPAHVINSNIWFFRPDGAPLPPVLTLADCTAENPCQNISQSAVDQIGNLANSAQFYFAPGAYAIPQQPGQPDSGTNAWITFTGGQALFGRTRDYRGEPTLNSRPVIYGGLFWGNMALGLTGSGAIFNLRVINNNQIIPLNVTGTPSFINNAAIAVGATDSMYVDNSYLSNISIDDNTASVSVYAGLEATVNRSILAAEAHGNATFSSADARAYGIYATNNVNVNQTTISANTFGSAASEFNVNFVRAFGIQTLSQFGNVSVTNARISANTFGSGTENGNAQSFGILASGSMHVADSLIEATTRSNSTGGGTGAGLASAVGAGSVGQGTVVNSTILASTSGNATNIGDVSAIAYSPGDGNNLLINSRVTATTRGNASDFGNASATGVSNPIGNVYISNSIITANTFGTATGFGNVNAIGVDFPVITINDSTINVNAINIDNTHPFSLTSSFIFNNTMCFKNGNEVICGN